MEWIRWGSGAMFAAVAFGAFGAHALKQILSGEQWQVYQTAVLYHLVHGLALLVVGWVSMMRPHEGLVRQAG